MGTGDIVETDLAGTKTNDGFQASSYFDGRASYEVSGTNYRLSGTTGVNAFSCRFTRPTSREEAFLNQGAAAHVNFGNMAVAGEIGVPMNVGGTGPTADLGLYSDAVNRRVVTLNWVLANGPVLTCTAFWRIQIAAALVFRMRPKPAPGNTGLKYNATWEISRMAPASMKVAAEYFAPIRGPFNIGASSNTLRFTLNGGSPFNVVLSTDATTTVDEVVTQLNADATFAAAATADNYLGFLRIVSDVKGSTSLINIDTAVANTASTAFGFNNTTRAGRDNCQARSFVYNTIATNVY
jgi:hypothetical protein